MSLDDLARRWTEQLDRAADAPQALSDASLRGLGAVLRRHGVPVAAVRHRCDVCGRPNRRNSRTCDEACAAVLADYHHALATSRMARERRLQHHWLRWEDVRAAAMEARRRGWMTVRQAEDGGAR